MGLSRLIFLFLFCFSPLFSYDLEDDPHFDKLKERLYGVIRKQALLEGAESRLSGIYAIKLAGDRNLFTLLKTLSEDPSPHIQLAALQLSATSGEEFVEEVLLRAMRSPFLLMRFEAAFLYAKLKLPKAFGQIEALMYKAPEKVVKYFPDLFAPLQEDGARAHFRKLLHHPDEEVRLAGVNAIGNRGMLDFLPEVKTLTNQLNLKLQEAGATVLGMLSDVSSLDTLNALTQSKETNIRVAAALSLYRMGDFEKRGVLFEEAKKGNLFAIFALREISQSEPLLKELLQSKERNIRLNATFALLERGDIEGLKGVGEVLVSTHEDFAYLPVLSGGKSLLAFKATPLAAAAFKKNPYAYEVSLQMRETTLAKIQQLGPKPFLAVCRLLFERGQLDLVPACVELLTMQGGDEEVAFLKEFQETLGIPLIRGYCKLGLFKLDDPSVKEKELHALAKELHQDEEIQLRTQLPFEMRYGEAVYDLTPEENSRLLVDIYLNLADRRSEEGIDALLERLENGDKHHQALIAAALLHAIR